MANRETTKQAKRAGAASAMVTCTQDLIRNLAVDKQARASELVSELRELCDTFEKNTQ